MAPASDGRGGRHGRTMAARDEGATDDARIGYLSGDEGVVLDAADQAELDELRALLADPTLWAEPPAELEDSVVGLIAAERAAAHGTANDSTNITAATTDVTADLTTDGVPDVPEQAAVARRPATQAPWPRLTMTEY